MKTPSAAKKSKFTNRAAALALAMLLCLSGVFVGAPQAAAAAASGSTMRAMPQAWEGSTTTGRWDISLSAGTAERSRVLRV